MVGRTGATATPARTIAVGETEAAELRITLLPGHRTLDFRLYRNQTATLAGFRFATKDLPALLAALHRLAEEAAS